MRLDLRVIKKIYNIIIYLYIYIVIFYNLNIYFYSYKSIPFFELIIFEF